MSSDNQYTALGPAAVGFQTNGANIDKALRFPGNTIGIRGIGGRTFRLCS